VGELAWRNLVFPVERQLFAQEQHLGTQFRSGRDCQPQKLNAFAGCNKKESSDRRSCAVLRINGWRQNFQVVAGK
jgi:hypothetical protein